MEDRKNIELGIIEGLCKSQIAKKINRNISTVSKEIIKHRKLKPRNTFNADSICIHLKECRRCIKKCERYQEPSCSRRDRNIGACNCCPNISRCKLDKYFYYANKANEAYLYTLVDSRVGVNLTYPELKQIATIMKPLLDKGQTIYQILENHPEITQCAKTIYTYIEMGLFKDFGIDNFSLKRKVSRKIRSKKLKKRKQPVNYEGREYKDYLEYAKTHPFESTTEMDTLYNHQSGPYIQTFIFENTSLMIGFLHQEKTSISMASTLDKLQLLLEDDYYTHFSLLLTDRGSEFEKYGKTSEVENLNKEIECLSKYLPAEVSEEEINKTLDVIFDELKPESMKDMGRVMKEATSRLGAGADGSLISKLVKERLSK